MDGIQGIIFDYGGTLDTNGIHWAEVLWKEYVACALPVSNADFREAYVHGERTMARQPLVKNTHSFHDVLMIKVRLQLEFLITSGKLDKEAFPVDEYTKRIADACYNEVLKVVNITGAVLKRLKNKYNLVLVSNFYGNIRTILKDFNLLCYFKEVIESAVVGVRKPDPAIFSLGVEALGYSANEILVVGDSFSKDIVPAHAVGCKTVWLKGIGWGNEEIDESLPDVIISDLAQLPNIIENS